MGRLITSISNVTIAYLALSSKVNVAVLIVMLTSILVVSNDIYSYYSNDYLRVYFLDVGQGDSILIITPDKKSILIDAGEEDRAASEIGKIIPFFVKNIDYFIGTHSDRDHIGGFKSLVSKYDIKNVYINDPVKPNDNDYLSLKKDSSRPNTEFTTLFANSELRIGDISIEILYPSQEDYESIETDNNRSIVVYLKYNDYDLLLTGDLEKDGELRLISSMNIGEVDVLKLGHHGSKTSSSQEFLKLSKPTVSIVSAGRDNKFGHPHQEVLDRGKALDSSIYSTQDLGIIKIETNGFSYWIENL